MAGTGGVIIKPNLLIIVNLRNNFIAVQQVVGGNAVHRFLGAQARFIVTKAELLAVFGCRGQAAAVAPGEAPAVFVAQRVADCIVSDFLTVVGGQQVFPLAVASVVGSILRMSPFQRIFIKNIIRIPGCLSFSSDWSKLNTVNPLIIMC